MSWRSSLAALAALSLVTPLALADGESVRMHPPPPRDLTRVELVARPFLSLTGNGGGGGISDLVIEHYLSAPFKLSATLSPIAAAADRYNAGTLTHARVGASYVGDFFELGISGGTRRQNLTSSGISLGANLRLGVLDGANLAVDYGYLVGRNYATGVATTAISNLRVKFELPVGARVKLFLDAAFSFDVWLYGMFGLTHSLGGDLSHAPWRLTAGFGLAFVVDRLGCPYRFPAPCAGTASALGPALQIGVERRF
jgi:hypothetical protein